MSVSRITGRDEGTVVVKNRRPLERIQAACGFGDEVRRKV
jgi:hypothetical protein